MAKLALALLLAIFSIGTVGCADKQVDAQTNESVFSKDFGKFIKDYNKRTGEQQNQYWQEIKGKEIEWDGEIHDAFVSSLDNKRHVVVRVASAAFVVAVLSDSEPNDILSLNKGEQIRFKGLLADQGGLIKSWTVSDANIIK